MCGADETDVCPYNHCAIVLFVTPIVAIKYGGSLEDDNLKTVCSTCADGLSALYFHSLIPESRAKDAKKEGFPYERGEIV